MEPRREPPCHTLDQPGQERPGRPGQVDCSTVTAAGGSTGCGLAEGNGGVFSFSSSSSLEGGSTNSDSDRGGKRPRRRKRVPRQAAERGGAWAGMQAESVWFDRAVYERAESAYQAWLAGGAPPEPRSRSPQPSDCRHGDQVACHHLVQAVWVNKSAFESAERSFMERTQPSPATPSSLALSPRRGAPAGPSRTPDEGYLSLTPTPATPLAPPAARRSVNGLPGLPAELLTGVWVEKSRYDRAEATYYQSLCRPPATPAHTPTDAPACNGAGPSCVFGVQRGAPEPQQADARPCPAQPGEGAGQDGLLCFLHPDSERAWLEAPRFCAAERHFHERQAAAEARPPDDDPTTPSMPRSEYDSTMTGVEFLAQEKIWFDKFRYDEAECRFYERMNGPTQPAQETGANSILQDIARARENIQKSLSGGVACGAGDQGELVARMKSLELENQNLHKVVEDLRSALCRLESRVALLEKRPAAAPAPAPAPAPACTKTAPIQQPKVRAPVEEDDDDLDLFGSDEEDEEAEKIREERLKAYAEKKAKKPALIAKSSILLDVKPWDDETDMVKLEECVRSVQADGLLWGSSKLVAVGYGIKKLQIQCVVEDDKVGTDMLEEEITKFEDYVQSVDVAAFNKI